MKPVAFVFISIVVIHDAFTFLIITKPQTYIFVVVREIICATTMLLVLKPLTFIFFTIGKRVDAISLTFSLHKFALINISVFIHHITLTVWLSRQQFPLILPTFGSNARAQCYFLSMNRDTDQRHSHKCYYMFFYDIFHFNSKVTILS